MLTLETPTCSGQDRTAILIARLKWVAFATLAIGWLIFAAVFASVGLFTLDESIYLLLLHASAYGGHLTIWNGYEEIPSAALRLGHLAAGPHGLTPEPPSGWGFLAAPFYRLAGIRAIELLNTLAAIATLLFTYRISLSLYHNRRLSLNAALLLGFATFLAEYAFGVWPHATSVAMETGSALCVLLAAEKDSRKAILWVALGGLILGSALQFRVSAILVAPPLIAWLLITQRERLLLPLVYVLGAVPGLAVSTFLNDYKFGSLSPLSYGVVHGAASASSYAGLAAVGIGIGLLALLLTHRPVRTRMRASHLWLIAGLLVLAALAAPPLRDMVERIAKGVWVLVVDLHAYDHVGQELGVERDPSGVVLFFGVLKRAFLQSIPWGALLVIPIAQAIRRRDLPAHLFSFLIIGAWIAPFAYRADA